MKKSIGILAGVAAALVALVLAGGAFGASGGIGVSDGSAAPGETGDVTLDATGVGDPGLGAWTVDISYDTSVITAVDCEPEEGGVCNEAFAEDTVRITGASASGLDGDTNLGSITFECADAAGESDLEITLSVFADATIGDPQDIDATISDGTFTCAEAEATATPEVTGGPATGTGMTSDGGSQAWLVALLAVAGTAVLAAGYGALRLRTR